MKPLHKTRSNRATEFSRDLARVLVGRRARKKFEGLTWFKNWPLPNGETIDVAGVIPYQTKSKSRDETKPNKKDKPIVMIEAELLREDPASNVVKIWKWANTTRPKQHCLFVQSFAKAYRGKKKERFRRADFVAHQMMKDCPKIKYKAVRLAYNPRPGGKVGAGKRRDHARNLAYSVIRLWKEFQFTR